MKVLLHQRFISTHSALIVTTISKSRIRTFGWVETKIIDLGTQCCIRPAKGRWATVNPMGSRMKEVHCGEYRQDAAKVGVGWLGQQCDNRDLRILRGEVRATELMQRQIA